jgi:hypothetical protein
VPAVRYGLGIGGIAAVVAIIAGFRIDYRVAVFGTVIVLALMFVLVLLARGSTLPGKHFHRPMIFAIWAFTFLLFVTMCFLIGKAFFDWPKAPFLSQTANGFSVETIEVIKRDRGFLNPDRDEVVVRVRGKLVLHEDPQQWAVVPFWQAVADNTNWHPGLRLQRFTSTNPAPAELRPPNLPIPQPPAGMIPALPKNVPQPAPGTISAVPDTISYDLEILNGDIATSGIWDFRVGGILVNSSYQGSVLIVLLAMKKDTIDANRVAWIKNKDLGFPSLPSNALAISPPKAFETTPGHLNPTLPSWLQGDIK